MNGRWRRRSGILGAVLLLLVVALGWAAPAPAMHGASGSRLLTWRYSEAVTGAAAMRDIVARPGGGAFAVGSTATSGSDAADVLVVKFGAGKTPVWTRTWDNGVGGAYALVAAVDGDGGLAVAGQTDTQTASDDWCVLKYAADGDLLWAVTLGGDAPSSDYVNAIACDRRGNVYVAGSLLDAEGNHRFAVVKFAAGDGKVVWQYAPDGLDPDWHDDQAMDLAVDGTGTVYATGISFGTGAEQARRCLTVRLSRAGEPVWSKVIAAQGLDRYGYYLERVGTALYVGMQGELADESGPLMLAKYSTGGKRSWLRSRAFKGVEWMHPRDLAAGTTGAVVVAAGDEGDEAVIAKFTPSGRLAWSHVYRTVAGKVGRDFEAVCMDESGRVWVAGQALIPDGEWRTADWLVQRFSATGATAWTKTLGGIEGGYDGLGAATLAGTSYLWVAGGLANSDSSVQYPAVGKYRR